MNNRRTGRTTRMLAEAKRLNDIGRAVYVIAANESEKRRLRNLYTQLYGEDAVQFENGSTLVTLDWERGRLFGANSNCVVLADHYAAESYAPWLIRMANADFGQTEKGIEAWAKEVQG